MSDSLPKLYFQFLLCLVIFLLCGKDGMPGLQTPALCAVAETCPAAKVRQLSVGISSPYLSNAHIWTYIRNQENFQWNFIGFMLSHIYSSKQRWQDSSCWLQPYNMLYSVSYRHSSTLKRTEDRNHPITPVTVCIPSFLLFWGEKMACLCHFRQKYPSFNINNYTLTYRQHSLYCFC